MCHHLFADDTQGFRSGHPSDISAIVTGVEDCLSDVSSWSAANQLQLNTTNTEILWFGSVVTDMFLSSALAVVSASTTRV